MQCVPEDSCGQAMAGWANQQQLSTLEAYAINAYSNEDKNTGES